MLNKIFLQGRLCADPEYKQTVNGVSLCNFRVAVDRDYLGPDGERQADFINCTAWRGTADFVAKYFAKGSPVLLVGQLTSRGYEDKSGQKRTAYEVVTDRVYFCGGKAEKQTAGQPGYTQPAQQSYTSAPANPAGEIMGKYQAEAGKAADSGGKYWDYNPVFNDNPGDQQTFGLEEMDGDLPY